MNNKSQIIVCAAIKSSSGLIVCGARHFDSFMRMQIERSGGFKRYKIEKPVGLTKEWIEAEDCFIDNQGNFLTREEAWVIAEKNGILYSENLY